MIGLLHLAKRAQRRHPVSAIGLHRCTGSSMSSLFSPDALLSLPRNGVNRLNWQENILFIVWHSFSVAFLI